MKYKTNIEIVTDAEDKNEAIEIVGEYLSGNGVYGIDMKCSTKPVHNHSRVIMSVSVILLFLVAGTFVVNNTKPHQGVNNCSIGSNAVQPPLKTSVMDKKDSRFKDQWETKRTEEALGYIKSTR